MQKHNSKKVAIISGGSRGLGGLLVKKLLQKNYYVASFSRQESDFIQDMKSSDPDEKKFFFRALDLNSKEEISQYIKDVSNHFGQIDILINNAAILMEGMLVNMKNSDIENLVSTNILSTILLTKLCLKKMILNKAGRIINISSINAIRGYAGVSIYAATKAAIDAFGRSLARELGTSNITINSVIPGFFESELTKNVNEEMRLKIQKKTALKRLGTVEEIANTVLFLCSEDSKFITGQSIVVDGGITV